MIMPSLSLFDFAVLRLYKIVSPYVLTKFFTLYFVMYLICTVMYPCTYFADCVPLSDVTFQRDKPRRRVGTHVFYMLTFRFIEPVRVFGASLHLLPTRN